ncbi:MAG: hypothetical protein EBT26_03385 [Microbacteriaceae bacterium]|nr:hypothetical protein [Microbacteriaceae bacterium]NBS61084.1 hypothetical protein [Microbacteriaceae bacterium]
MRRLASIFTSGLILLLLTGCASSNEIAFSDDQIYKANYPTVVGDEHLTAAIQATGDHGKKACSQLGELAISSNEVVPLEKRVNYLVKVSYGTPWNAKRFLDKTTWAFNSLHSNVKVPTIDSSEVEEVAAAYLDPILTKIALRFVDPDGKTIKTEDIDAFVNSYHAQAIKLLNKKFCKVNFSRNSTYNSLVDRFNMLLESVNDLASSAPWYPEGYKESPDDSNMAWKWARGISCSYGDSCWHVKVISAVTCTDVYAEINIMDSSGSIIDWTNDTLGYLAPGNVGTLEFRTYNDYAQTGSLTKLHCN